MTATDLMIGDLVRIGDNIGEICSISAANHKYPDLIEYVLAGKFNESSHTIGLEKVLPIPLTPEILEKNGFKKYPYKNSYWYCDEMLELFMKIVCIFPIKDRKIYSLLSTAAPRLTAGEDDVYIRCDYVHELQHALKLCGIEKEIVL